MKFQITAGVPVSGQGVDVATADRGRYMAGLKR